MNNTFISPRKSIIILFITVIFFSCNDDILNEVPKSFFNADVLLVDKAGFENAITAIHQGLRHAYYNSDGSLNNFCVFHEGTDICMTPDSRYKVYSQTLTPEMPNGVEYIWNVAYRSVLPRANMVIHYADKPDVTWANDKEKNAIVAEARFFRAYAHNMLANVFGGVPIADQFFTEPKVDFVRASRQAVYQFVAEDLEFASKWLPVDAPAKGRIAKAAADHLLTEVYISLGRYDDAINSASDVIESPKYGLMNDRFGKYKNNRGDVFSDLFKETNQNSAENKETIWAIQIEYGVPGGGVYRFTRYWNSRYYDIKDPNGVQAMILCDSLGRPNGWFRGTPHVYYDVWGDRKDMRCSDHNFRWDFYVNNPASKYLGQKIDPKTFTVDTMRSYYPTIRKIEGIFYDGPSSPHIYVDQYMMRLAETYLLRAEAYVMKGDKSKAAADINVVRGRAKATPVETENVDLDYILDERIRELLVEEPRLLTLIRTGKLVERVRKYHTVGGSTIQDFHQLFPIPQSAIDANFGAKLEQNPGY